MVSQRSEREDGLTGRIGKWWGKYALDFKGKSLSDKNASRDGENWTSPNPIREDGPKCR